MGYITVYSHQRFSAALSLRWGLSIAFLSSSSLLLLAVSLPTSSFRITSPSTLLSIFLLARLSVSAVSPYLVVSLP